MGWTPDDEDVELVQAGSTTSVLRPALRSGSRFSELDASGGAIARPPSRALTWDDLLVTDRARPAAPHPLRELVDGQLQQLRDDADDDHETAPYYNPDWD